VIAISFVLLDLASPLTVGASIESSTGVYEPHYASRATLAVG
jgi:hypothetical protein